MRDGYYRSDLTERDKDNDMFHFHHWNAGRAPSLQWDINNARLHGIPDYSEFHERASANGFDSTDVREAYDMDEEWEPMAQLFDRLPGLREVVYKCPVQFPPCLLQALHDKMPQITPRLHLRAFKLRMMNDTITAWTDPDPHEMALLKSPCLDSLWFVDTVASWYRWISSRSGDSRDREEQKNLHAFGEMVDRWPIAPNLHEVGVMRNYTHVQGSRSDNILLAIMRNAAKKNTLRLKTLNLDCAYVSQILAMDPSLDLSMLRALHLLKMSHNSVIDALSAQSLPLLRDLSIQFIFTASWKEYDRVKQFVRGFRNLESLRVRGWDWSVASFSDWCGEITPYQTVRSLDLGCGEEYGGMSSSVQTELEIMFLGYVYSGVETLSLPIRRSKGDQHEVRLYQTLGRSFPKLKRLALTLEALLPSAERLPSEILNPAAPARTHLSGAPGVYRDPLGSWDPIVQSRESYSHLPFPKQPFIIYGCSPFLNGEILDLFINSAVDAKLARQIFDAISSSCHTSSRLETMMVRSKALIRFRSAYNPEPESNGYVAGTGTGYGRCDPDGYIRPLLTGLTREWLLDTLLCDDSGEKVRVKEIGARAEGLKREPVDPQSVPITDQLALYMAELEELSRRKSCKRGKHLNERKGWWEDVRVSEENSLMVHFRELWPGRKEGGRGWWEDWESWDLETVSEQGHT